MQWRLKAWSPPSEKRFWPEPQHFVHVATEAHNPDTGSILRAGMIGMELILAQQAPHDLVLLDGSFTSPIIYFNQGFSKAKEYPNLKTVEEYLVKEIKSFLEAYHCVLAPQRSDRQWVAVPKYTTRREIGTKLGWPASHDDRGLLSSVLEAGEYTIPIAEKSIDLILSRYLSSVLEAGEYTSPTLLLEPAQPWHLNTSVVDDFTDVAERDEINELVEQVIQFLGNIHVLYYRPHAYMPALRLEMSRAIANNPARLSVVLQGIKDQCGTAAIMEPYPLYLADRMVKHLPQGCSRFSPDNQPVPGGETIKATLTMSSLAFTVIVQNQGGKKCPDQKLSQLVDQAERICVIGSPSSTTELALDILAPLPLTKS